MIAEIISIGNELLNGFTVNTNASFISRCLSEIGIPVQNVQTIADTPEAITSSLELALARSEAIFMTGGLGPTHDDITKKVICDHLGYELVFDEKLWDDLRLRFERRGIKIPEVNKNQALVPKGAELMPNSVGSALGLIFEKNGKFIFVMPGVPGEMKPMMRQSVGPFLHAKCRNSRVQIDIFRTTGIAESAIYEKIESLLKTSPQYTVAFLPKFTGVDIRVSRQNAAADDDKSFEKFAAQLREIIGKFIYSETQKDLPEILGEILLQENSTLAVAESITGGLIQHNLTQVSGSSQYFMGGAVTYSNASKMQLLGVSETALKNEGAVSLTVAEQMATGARKLFNTDYAISTTGIAGPTGATEFKPVGLVYIGIATKEKNYARKFQFVCNRRINKERAAQAAIELLRREILGIK